MTVRFRAGVARARYEHAQRKPESGDRVQPLALRAGSRGVNQKPLKHHFFRKFSFMTKFAQRFAAGSALVAGSVGSAFAAVPADVTSALGDLKTDGLVIAGAVLVAIIAIAAFKMMRKAI